MSVSQRAQHIASIPPGASFLPTLVDALLTGNLIPEFAPGRDPLALADATIWVPTRRAVRALSTEFVRRLEGEAALLPSIRALGDVDEDDVFFDLPNVPLMTKETVGSTERQRVLAQMISAWTNSLNDTQRALYDGKDILMPASFADAIWFAQDLAGLMDMVSTEEVPWSALDDLVPSEGNFADWWKLTLQFLQIATSAWPSYLEERNCVDGAALRAQWLRKQAQIYRSNGAKGPVIAAGSTGSIPATSDLLETIAQLPNGMVVLPGLDRSMDDQTWAKVDLPDNDRDDGGTAPGHPQYGLKRLIDRLGYQRGDIFHLGGIDSTGSGYSRIREEIVSVALLPSSATGEWRSLCDAFTVDQRIEAFKGVSLIEASGEREEALAIALALREKLEDPNHTAALVTPDRNLARRVAVELRRFGLDVDDSAGQPLRNRSHGIFARLVVQVGFSAPDPIALVSLIKHPLALFGGDKKRARHAAHMLELAALRGAVVPPVLGELAARMEKIRLLHEQEIQGHDEERAPWPVARFDAEDWDDAFWLAQKLDSIFSDQTGETLKDHATLSIALIEACGRDEGDSLLALYKEEEGQALASFLTELGDQMDDHVLDGDEWPDVFDAFLGGRVVRPTSGTHPRLSILGPLEARLQTYDRVVLGGLNEGVWPSSSRNDPFLSRPMKATLKLPPPERRTGLAAHDIQMLLGMEDAVIARSIRADNAPTISSRWLQRLLIVAGSHAEDHMLAKGHVYLDWVAQIDQAEGIPEPAQRPRPCPPLSYRPRQMSVTEVETWVNDPYAIYARKILKLKPLDPFIREADAREKGTLYHAILEDYLRSHARLIDRKEAIRNITAIADARFESSIVPIEIAALWRPRFDDIAQSFIDWHIDHQRTVKDFHIELYAKTDVESLNFTLSGRADRVDFLLDGTAALFDYKTGLNPSKSAVLKLYAPQLPLEAALISQGAFKQVGQITASCLAYIRLRPGPEFKVEKIESKSETATSLGQKSWQQLCQLIDYYDQEDTPYVSKARVHINREFEGDYDHLARVKEWSYGAGDDEA